MIKKNQIFTLDKLEQKIVYTIANERQTNKEKTGWNGYRTVAEKNDVNLNLVGFGAEFIFCRELNLFPDFTILNTSFLNNIPILILNLLSKLFLFLNLYK